MTADPQATNDSTRTARRAPSVGARRFGYVVAILINGVLLYLINVWPTWEVFPWLTRSTAEVIPWINASIIVGMIANVLYLFYDRRWFKAIGDLVTTSVGLAAMLQLWEVFPFDFGDLTVPWALLTRILIGLAIVGSAIAIVVQVVILVREIVRLGRDR